MRSQESSLRPGSRQEEKTVREMAKEIALRVDGMRVKEMNFVSRNQYPGYSKSEIEKDLDKVKDKESKYFYESAEAMHADNIARGFEGAVIISAKEMNWLGEDSEVMTPSVFDDTYHAADMMIVERGKKDGASAGVTFDITTSNKEDIVNRKVSKSLENAVTNKFSQPKYVFLDTPMSEQPKMPVGIFACPQENAEKLVRAVYLNNEEGKRIQLEFRAFFGLQLKMFLSESIRIAEILTNAKSLKVRKEAEISLQVLQKDFSFISKKFSYAEVPAYLLGDESFKKFEVILRKEGEEICKELLSKDTTEDISWILEKKRRPRIPSKF